MAADDPDDLGPSGWRRDRGADVGAELAALRRLHTATDAIARESAGLLAELAPTVLDNQSALTSLRAQVAVLAADAEDTAAEDPAVTAAKTAIGLRPDPPWPWRWQLFTPEQAAAAWDQLGRWVGEILVPDYGLTRTQLPDCWPHHPRWVTELSWLRGTYLEAHTPHAPAGRAADWHLRHLPGVLAAIDRDVRPGDDRHRRCGPRHHLERVWGHDVDGADDPASIECWGPACREVAAADLARRRGPGSRPPDVGSGSRAG